MPQLTTTDATSAPIFCAFGSNNTPLSEMLTEISGDGGGLYPEMLSCVKFNMSASYSKL